MDTSAFVVVDIWRVKPGKRAAIEPVLAESARLFRAQPGILSVDYTHIDGDAEHYLVVFRYESAMAREAFQMTDALKETTSRLRELWDMESPVLKGSQSGL
jgi:heme-degrading monooxygenase HmoA